MPINQWQLPLVDPLKINSMTTKWKYLCFTALILPCFNPGLWSQNPIALPSAIDSAMKNNLSIRNENLKTAYAKALVSTAAAIPLTSVTGEWGQFNSVYFDSKIGISQSISLPTVYARQKQLFSEEWKASLMGLRVKETEIKKAVRETFYNYLYWMEKEKLLENIDSLYSRVLQKATLRLQKGESNVLEKATFETQKSAIQLQLNQVQQEKAVLQEIFQLLLNTDRKFIPDPVRIKLEDVDFSMLSVIDNHPALQWMGQQQEIVKANTRVEESKLLPGLLLGYYNTSMKGMGADDKTYGAGYRFSSAQVGIEFPLFATAQKNRVKASRINEQVAINNYQIEKQALKTRLAEVLIQYGQQQNAVALHETQYRKIAPVISETAHRQFLNGEINYLDFVLLINQTVQIQNSYLEAVHNFNQTAIQALYLLNK